MSGSPGGLSGNSSSLMAGSNATSPSSASSSPVKAAFRQPPSAVQRNINRQRRTPQTLGKEPSNRIVEEPQGDRTEMQEPLALLGELEASMSTGNHQKDPEGLAEAQKVMHAIHALEASQGGALGNKHCASSARAVYRSQVCKPLSLFSCCLFGTVACVSCAQVTLSHAVVISYQC